MYQDHDDDFEFGQFGPAGAPDPESAGSSSLWIQGLLENPLGDVESSDEQEIANGATRQLEEVG